MPITIERRGAQLAVRMPPEPDGYDAQGGPLYEVDPTLLADLKGAQRELRESWGLEPHGSVPDSETLMYFRPTAAPPILTLSRLEWEALVARVARLERGGADAANE